MVENEFWCKKRTRSTIYSFSYGTIQFGNGHNSSLAPCDALSIVKTRNFCVVSSWIRPKPCRTSFYQHSVEICPVEINYLGAFPEIPIDLKARVFDFPNPLETHLPLNHEIAKLIQIVPFFDNHHGRCHTFWFIFFSMDTWSAKCKGHVNYISRIYIPYIIVV